MALVYSLQFQFVSVIFQKLEEFSQVLLSDHPQALIAVDQQSESVAGLLEPRLQPGTFQNYTVFYGSPDLFIAAFCYQRSGLLQGGVERMVSLAEKQEVQHPDLLNVGIWAQGNEGNLRIQGNTFSADQTVHILRAAVE